MKKPINLLILSAICIWIATLPAPDISPESRKFVSSLGIDPWCPSPKDWMEKGWLLRALGYKQGD